MTQILINRIGSVGFQNGIVRIECLAVGADGKPQNSGTLLMPGSEAGRTLSAIAAALQELQKQVQNKGSLGQP